MALLPRSLAGAASAITILCLKARGGGPTSCATRAEVVGPGYPQGVAGARKPGTRVFIRFL